MTYKLIVLCAGAAIGLWLIVQIGHAIIYLLLKGDEDERFDSQR